MINHESQSTKDVPSQVKNPDLVTRRRLQIVDASVKLFIEKGFHKTTTREIAKASGISTGLLYEYVRSKEDVLFLVCDAIHVEVENAVADAIQRASYDGDVLPAVIREYFLVCDRMSDHILLVYQETRTLPPHWRKRVLQNEVKLTSIFIKILKQLTEPSDLPKIDPAAIELAAHTITVLGHMWTFRRWFLARRYSIDDYIRLQTEFILGKFNVNAEKLILKKEN